MTQEELLQDDNDEHEYLEGDFNIEIDLLHNCRQRDKRFSKAPTEFLSKVPSPHLHN